MSAPQKKVAVAYLVERRQCSQRRACRLTGLSRATARYAARLVPADEAVVVERLHKFAKKRRRRGYRLAHRELRREGWCINHKRIHRLWKREGLSVSPRRKRNETCGIFSSATSTCYGRAPGPCVVRGLS